MNIVKMKIGDLREKRMCLTWTTTIMIQTVRKFKLTEITNDKSGKRRN